MRANKRRKGDKGQRSSRVILSYTQETSMYKEKFKKDSIRRGLPPSDYRIPCRIPCQAYGVVITYLRSPVNTLNHPIDSQELQKTTDNPVGLHVG